MTNIYSHKAGETRGCHEAFLQELTKKGATVVNSPGESHVIIVFCPIVSRYETDINAALSSIPESAPEEVILVTMHHTFDKNYTLPNYRDQGGRAVALHVDCLFFETKGLLKCQCNNKAIEMVCKKLLLGKYSEDKGCMAVICGCMA